MGDALIGIPYDDDGATNGGSVALLAGAESGSWTGDLHSDARAWIDGGTSNDLLGYGLAFWISAITGGEVTSAEPSCSG